MQATEHLHEHEHDRDHAHSSTQAWAKTILLLGLGLYFVYIIASGNLTNYINVRFAWLSYLAAVLFLLIGVGSAYDLLKGHHHEHHHDHDHEHDHNHGQMSWWVLGIVAVPLVLGTLIPSQPLSASAVGGNISIKAVAVDSAAAFSKAPKDRNVLDWLREFNTSTNPASFDGQEADVIGFVYREPTFPKNTFMVARFAITCCVADASAIGLPVLYDKAATLTDGDWVRVAGAFKAGDFRGTSVPILQVKTLDKVPQPDHPYLYP
jgi:uncharacterized repeat protein (TIGR03943 family)